MTSVWGKPACLLFLSAVFTHVSSLTFPPLIVEQPTQNQIPFNVGESLKLVCRANGEPEPTYYWYFNDKLFDASGNDNRIAIQPGVGTLVFSNPIKKDEGFYQCFAKNQFGISASVRVYLREAVLGQFRTKVSVNLPTVHRVKVGHSLVMKCTPPTSYPAAEIIWTLYEKGITPVRLDSRITIDHEGNLIFANVVQKDYQDNKIYACTVDNKFVGKNALGAFQRVKPIGETVENSAPVLLKHTPFDTTVARGDTFSAKCIFGGRPTPRVEWTRSYTGMSKRARTGSFGMELVIENIQPDDAGTYECLGINAQTSTPESRAFKVKVLSPPSWEERPENVDAGEGDTVEFLCIANGNPLPVYKWFINGTEVSKLPKDPRRSVETNRMVFYNLEKDDAKVIQCNASNTVGYLWANAYLNVLSEAPTITSFPGNVVAAEGLTVILKCEVKGSPKPLVVWRKGSEQLTGGRFTVLKAGHLQITQLNLVDAGEYHCNASNKFGQDGAIGNLIVRRKTQILTQPLDLMVVRDSEAKFTCTATTDPAEIRNLQIMWKKDGQLIDYSKAQRMFENYMDNSLTISGTIHLDTGEYTCVATNGLDSQEASAQLVVQDIPDAPVNVHVDCYKEKNTAEVYWSPSKENFAPILNFIVQYNTSFTPDTWNDANSSVPQNFRKVDIALSPWGNYTFRVRARNKVGVSPPSEPTKTVCKTEKAKPDKAPDNVFAEGDRPDNMIIYWTPMPKIEQNGPNFYYMINYFVNGSQENHYQRVDRWERDRLEVPEQLPTYVEYIIEIYAVNTDGNGPRKQIVGHSGEDAPLEIPQNVQVDTLTIKPTIATLTWDEIDKSSERIRGFFKGYRIQFWKTKDGPESMREVDWIIQDPRRYGRTRTKRQAELATEPPTQPPTDPSAVDPKLENLSFEGPKIVKYVLRDLPPFSDITVRVMVLNKGYAGQPSLDLNFRTPEGLPAPPAELTVLTRGPNFFDLSWERPLNDNGYLIGYNISYQLIHGLNLGRLQYRDPVSDPNALQAKLPGLMSERLYRVYLAASTRYGRGEPIFVDVETISPTKPNAPTFIVIDHGQTFARVKWEPSRYGNPGSVFYVQHRRKGMYHWYHSPDVYHKNTYNVSSLDPGITYQLRVVAKNGVAQETPSESIELRTEGTSAAEVNVGAMGWFIGLIVILFVMILLLIGFWFLKRTRDKWFEQKEQERAVLDQQSIEERNAYIQEYARSNSKQGSEDYEFESSKSHYSSSNVSDVKRTPSESIEYSDESFGDEHGAVGYSADPRGPPGAAVPPVRYQDGAKPVLNLDDRKPKAEESAMDTFV